MLFVKIIYDTWNDSCCSPNESKIIRFTHWKQKNIRLNTYIYQYTYTHLIRNVRKEEYQYLCRIGHKPNPTIINGENKISFLQIHRNAPSSKQQKRIHADHGAVPDVHLVRIERLMLIRIEDREKKLTRFFKKHTTGTLNQRKYVHYDDTVLWKLFWLFKLRLWPFTNIDLWISPSHLYKANRQTPRIYKFFSWTTIQSKCSITGP